jgi:hypothetical protein
MHTEEKPMKLSISSSAWRRALTRKIIVSLTHVCVHLFSRELAEVDTICAVDLPRDDGDLLLDREGDVVQELEVRGTFTNSDDGLCKGASACASLCPMITDDGTIGASSERFVADKCKLSRCIRAVKLTVNVASSLQVR